MILRRDRQTASLLPDIIKMFQNNQPLEPVPVPIALFRKGVARSMFLRVELRSVGLASADGSVILNNVVSFSWYFHCFITIYASNLMNQVRNRNHLYGIFLGHALLDSTLHLPLFVRY
jgi:hypothetical protein